MGLSHPEIARFVHLNPKHIRFRSAVTKLQYLLPLFISIDKLLLALNNNTYLLYANLDKVINPNVIPMTMRAM
jgi:hypothetical protein